MTITVNKTIFHATQTATNPLPRPAMGGGFRLHLDYKYTMNTDIIRDSNQQALHPEFQTLAQHNRKKLGACEEDASNDLVFAFPWHDTEQGRDFWFRVNRNKSTDADLALAIEANRNTTTTHPTPEPKKHSTMEDVFAGMNRHAKKENNKEKLTEEDKELLTKLTEPDDDIGKFIDECFPD